VKNNCTLVFQVNGLKQRRVSKKALNPTLNAKRIAGFSYTEVLVAANLVAMKLVPAMEAFMPAAKGKNYTQSLIEDRYQLTAKLEDVMAASFSEVDSEALTTASPTVASSYSDVVTYPDGRQITRNVLLSRYDGDNADANNNPFDGIDAGLLWVRVEIAGTSLSVESLRSDAN